VSRESSCWLCIAFTPSSHWVCVSRESSYWLGSALGPDRSHSGVVGCVRVSRMSAMFSHVSIRGLSSCFVLVPCRQHALKTAVDKAMQPIRSLARAHTHTHTLRRRARHARTTSLLRIPRPCQGRGQGAMARTSRSLTGSPHAPTPLHVQVRQGSKRHVLLPRVCKWLRREACCLFRVC
jgi:hypothetical protein